MKRFFSILLTSAQILCSLYADDHQELIFHSDKGHAIVAKDPIFEEEEDEDEGYIINFNDVQIVEYLRFISKITGKNFIFEESDLNFNVTIISEEPASVDNILSALLQVLRVHGFSMIEQGNNLIIHEISDVKRPGEVVTDDQSFEKAKENAEMITRLFKLHNLKAVSVAAIIQPLLSPQASVEVLEESEQMVVVDFATNVARISDIIRNLDVADFHMELGQYVIKSKSMTLLMTLADQILTPISKGSPIVFVAHPMTNSIFVVSTPALVQKAMGVLSLLDSSPDYSQIHTFADLAFSQEIEKQEMESKKAQKEQKIKNKIKDKNVVSSLEFDGTHFSIHKLQYRDGSSIQQVLLQLASKMQAEGQNPELVAAINSMQWMQTTNSLVFFGTENSIERVRELIREMDTPARQVYIEMLIIETDVDNSLNFGVEWGVRQNHPDYSTAIGSTTGSVLNTPLNAVSLTGAPNADTLANSQGFNIGVIGKVLTHNGTAFTSIGGVLNAIRDDARTEIVMTPKIITENNNTAEFFVGTNNRFRAQSLVNESSNVITSNFEFRDVGTLLQVTPTLGNNDVITMQIAQDVSVDLGSSANETIGPVTRKSTTRTRVHVPNHYFLIISGMIHEEKTKGSTRVPCLGGAPLVGKLFRNERNTGSKRNLMIFIRPHIIDTHDELRRLTQEQEAIFLDESGNRFELEKEGFSIFD